MTVPHWRKSLSPAEQTGVEAVIAAAELADGVYQQVKKHTWAGMRSELESVKQEFAQIMEARGETELAQKIRSVK